MSELEFGAVAHRAGPDDAAEIARLLHDFNTEFDTETPGAVILTRRLTSLLAGSSTIAYLIGDPAVGVALLTLRTNVWYDGPSTIAYLIGDPAVGVALLTLRTNVWYDGPVALLDELYVAPRHRGHGLGSAIINRVLRDAVDIGVSAIEINVDQEDVDAQRFYERHGFRGKDPDTGERAFYYALEL